MSDAQTSITRTELYAALNGNHRAVKHLEKINTSVTGSLPDAIAQAQQVADAANAVATALQALSFVLTSASQEAPNAHVLTEGTGISISVGNGHVTIALSVPLSVQNGGTGAADAADARHNLGLESMATQDAGAVAITGGSVSAVLTQNSTTLLSSSQSLANGAGAAAATLTNAPRAGNPSKWVAIDDDGTTRYVPVW